MEAFEAALVANVAVNIRRRWCLIELVRMRSTRCSADMALMGVAIARGQARPTY